MTLGYQTPAVYTGIAAIGKTNMLQKSGGQMKSTVDTMTSVSIHPIWFELVGGMSALTPIRHSEFYCCKSIKYSLSPVIGTDACQKPKYGDLHVCGKYVNFKTLGVQWRRLEGTMVGEGYKRMYGSPAAGLVLSTFLSAMKAIMVSASK